MSGPTEWQDGYVEQHHRESAELRRLCADRDSYRSQRDTLRAQLEAAEAANETVSQWAAEVVATYEAKEAELINLRTASISYSQQVNELIGRAGNAESRAKENFQIYVDANEARIDAEARAETAEAECARLAEVLDRIGGYTMSQFHSALDMASQCRTDAAMARTKEETK